MVITGACISGVADVRDHLSLSNVVSFGETSGVVREVCVIKDHFLIGAELVNRRAAAFTLEEFLNFAICCRKDGSFSSSGNVDRIVNAALGARGVEGVDQLIRSNSGDRDDEICCADEVRG